MDEPSLASLLFSLNQNITAVGLAVERIASWAAESGEMQVAIAVQAQLNKLVENANIIAEALNELKSIEGKSEQE